jgi:hypothetical protein
MSIMIYQNEELMSDQLTILIYELKKELIQDIKEGI